MSRSRMLVAVSSPWASQKMIEPIVDLAGRLDADALVAHVSHSKGEDQSETEARQRGEQTLEMLTTALKQAGITTEGLMLFSDDIPNAIVKTAQNRNCTLIVLGLTTGKRGVFKRLFGNDVPDCVMQRANMPVLLCPANWTGMV